MTFQSPAEKLVGATLNQRFAIQRLLGEGGMGAVYEAESKRGEGKRAVKLLHEEFVRTPEVRERFLAEAQATRHLVHPNIVPILESAIAEDGSPYLVMELLRGKPLGDKLEGGHILGPDEAYRITMQVLAALSAAHAQRIVHRDLKPDNIFLATDPGGNEIVKVLDFGIAKVMDAAGGMGSKTRTGALIGTPGYMSPEQIKNAKGVDPRSDLWGVATILYQMLTGQLPFVADNEFSRLTAVIVGHPTPIEEVNPALARYSVFFQRALAKDPNDRFQTAEEMAKALTAIMGPKQPASSAPPPKTAHGTQMMSSLDPATLPQPAPRQAPHAGSLAVADTDPAASPRNAANAAPPPSVHVQAYPPSTGYAPNTPYPPQPPHSTQMTPERPAGVPSIHGQPPNVAVVSAPPLRVPGVPYWMLGVACGVCLALGFLIGFLAGGK